MEGSWSDKFKGAIKSKTMWAVAGVIITAITPVLQEWVAAHPGVFSGIVAAVFGVLRTQTDQSLAEKGNPPGQPPSA